MIACERRAASSLRGAPKRTTELGTSLKRLHRGKSWDSLTPRPPESEFCREVLSFLLTVLSLSPCPSLDPEQHRQQHALLGKLPRRKRTATAAPDLQPSPSHYDGTPRPDHGPIGPLLRVPESLGSLPADPELQDLEKKMRFRGSQKKRGRPSDRKARIQEM